MAYFRDFDVDYNSLLPSDMSGPEMNRQNYPVVIPTSADATDFGIERAVYVDWNGTAAGRSQLLPAFCMPSGVTSGTLGVLARVRTQTGGNADKINLAIYDNGPTTRIVEREITLTTSWQWYSLPVSGLSPGTTYYYAAVETNHLGQHAKPELANLQFSPDFSTDSTSMWSQSRRVKRYGFKPGMSPNNAYTNWVVNYYRQSTELDWSFRTGADRCALEIYVQNSTATVIVECLCNGKVIGRSAPLPDLRVSIAEFTIPVPDPENIITFRTPLHSVSGGANPLGGFARAAYFPADATVEYAGAANPMRLAIVCDSIGLGMNASTWATQSMLAFVRHRFPGGFDNTTFVAAASGLKVYDIAKDPATIQDTAEKFARARPTHILLMPGVNDVIANPGVTWGQTEFQTQYGLLVDELFARIPGARIYAVSALVRNAADLPVHDGFTLAQERAAVAAVQSTRSRFMSYLAGDAANMPIASQTDGSNTHFLNDGHGVGGVGLCSFLGI